MAKQKYNVELSQQAERMLLRHTEFLSQVSSAAARRLVDSANKVKVKLGDNPYQFPFADEQDVPGTPREMYRKCLFDKRYKALFLIDGRDVFVDAVIDCRQKNKDINFSL